MNRSHTLPTAHDIEAAHRRFPPELVRETPLEHNRRLSELYGADVFLKREDQQSVHSYKVRGAANAIGNLDAVARSKGVVCASAGNHSQGVAASCNHFQVKGKIYMPKTTPNQKVEATQRLGNGFVEVVQTGDIFDEAHSAAQIFASETGAIFIHPFDDADTIAGQGTVALEIAKQMFVLQRKMHVLLVPVGGGGLIAGSSIYLHEHSPDTKIIGVEPEHAAAMDASVKAGCLVTLEKDRMSKFVDGAAVRTPGELGFQAVQKYEIPIITVPEDRLCGTMVDLAHRDSMLVEPAGALSIDGLRDIAARIREQTVVCVVSGGNFDVGRYQDVLDRAERFKKLRRYFTIELPNRPRALLELLNRVVEGVNICHFQYKESASGGTATAFVGMEAADPNVLSEAVRILSQETTVQEETRNPLLAQLIGD